MKATNESAADLEENAKVRTFTIESMSGQERKELALNHPLFTQSVLLPTRPIEELCRAVRRIVALRETGCCFAAHSGVGKTSALDLVIGLLRTEMPDLCVVQHDTHNQQFPSVRAFFKHFLSTVGHREKRGETYDLRERVVNWLVDEARITGMNMILLSVDEAHAMKMQDFNFLKDVYNDLHRAGVQLVTILMGQDPELLQVIEEIRNERRLDLIGRFAMRILPFRAFNCAEDIARVLSEIDSAEYPEGSGISWTQFYFPQSFKNGFRLKNEAELFMKAIGAVAPKENADRVDFPARQTFLAIRTFMIDNARYDKHEMQLPSNAWVEAVTYAKMHDAMRLMRAPLDSAVSVKL